MRSQEDKDTRWKKAPVVRGSSARLRYSPGYCNKENLFARNVYHRILLQSLENFLLLSWAGEALSSNSQPCWDSNCDLISRMNDQLRSLGVAHGDIRPANVLWNETLGQLTFIDFQRSTLIPRIEAKITELPSPSPPLTAKSKVSASSAYACICRQHETVRAMFEANEEEEQIAIGRRYDQQTALRFRHEGSPER